MLIGIGIAVIVLYYTYTRKKDLSISSLAMTAFLTTFAIVIIFISALA